MRRIGLWRKEENPNAKPTCPAKHNGARDVSRRRGGCEIEASVWGAVKGGKIKLKRGCAVQM